MEPLDRLQQALIDLHARAVQINKRVLSLFIRAMLTIHGDNPDALLPDIRRRGNRVCVPHLRKSGPINPTVVALLVNKRMTASRKEIVSFVSQLFDHAGIVAMETFCATDMVVAWKEFGQTLVCTPRQYTAVAKAIAKLLMFGSYEVLMVRYRFRGRITGGSVPLATDTTLRTFAEEVLSSLDGMLCDTDRSILTDCILRHSLQRASFVLMDCVAL